MCGHPRVVFRQHVRDKLRRAQNALVKCPLVTAANGPDPAEPAAAEPADATRHPFRWGVLANAGDDESVVCGAGGVGVTSEEHQDRLRGLPRPVDAADERGVSGPRKAVQLWQSGHQTRPQRVEMNVAEQLQQIGLGFDQKRLEAVLEDVAGAPVPPVEADGVTGVEEARTRP